MSSVSRRRNRPRFSRTACGNDAATTVNRERNARNEVGFDRILIRVIQRHKPKAEHITRYATLKLRTTNASVFTVEQNSALVLLSFQLDVCDVVPYKRQRSLRSCCCYRLERFRTVLVLPAKNERRQRAMAQQQSRRPRSFEEGDNR